MLDCVFMDSLRNPWSVNLEDSLHVQLFPETKVYSISTVQFVNNFHIKSVESNENCMKMAQKVFTAVNKTKTLIDRYSFNKNQQQSPQNTTEITATNREPEQNSNKIEESCKNSLLKCVDTSLTRYNQL